MPSHGQVIAAVFKRNFAAWFLNPTGYVFITVFILLGAIGAFWPTGFFLNNLANLDQLNALFPALLLFFIPALTMNAWSEERRQGTDELLFTLPVRDSDVVIGKYLALLGIYTVALVFSISHVVILSWLGAPDLGLMAATYFGYWLTGAALLAVGMAASLLTSNATVAFILGALLCSVMVFIHGIESRFGGVVSDVIRSLGVVPHFERFGDGVIAFGDVAYFIGLTVVMLYVNMVLLGRRRAGGREQLASYASHRLVRIAALAVAAFAIAVLIGRSGAAVDATAEDLHSLQPETRSLVDAVPADRPVFIQAFLSPDVPRSYVGVRKDIVNLLRQMDAVGGAKIEVAIHDTEPYTEVAAQAAANYNILPRPVLEIDAAHRSSREIFLGLVFTSGPDEFVIPFVEPGLPIEYELVRSIRVVSAASRKVLGVVATDANPFGGFNFEAMTNRPDWAFITELRKQYDVRQIEPAGPYPDDLDALLVIMPSTMSQPEIEVLHSAILTGTPTLLLDDPLPMFDPNLAPPMPKGGRPNPFSNQPPPQTAPKGDITNLLRNCGLQWQPNMIAWSAANPHPAIADASPEILFITRTPDNATPFNEASEVVSGLQEVVMISSGFVGDGITLPDATLERTPLMRTGTAAGTVAFDQLLEQSFFGLQQRRTPRRVQSAMPLVTAMRSRGSVPDLRTTPAEDVSAGLRTIDVLFVADVDFVSEAFFGLRRQGLSGFNFDNVTFALNAIDALAGDDSFVSLRKHRPAHRSLERVEALNQEFVERRRTEQDAAEEEARVQIADAKTAFQTKLEALRSRTDLDEQTRAVMARNLETVEQRRLDVVSAGIEQRRERIVDRAETEMQMGVNKIQRRIKWLAALLPPIPPLILAVVLFVRRASRERAAATLRQPAGAV